MISSIKIQPNKGEKEKKRQRICNLLNAENKPPKYEMIGFSL